MKRTLLPISLLLLFLSPTTFLYAQPTPKQTAAFANADSLQTITLKDGTVLKGHLIKIVDDIYVVETLRMGEVRVNVADLVNITTEGAGSSQNSYPASGNSAGMEKTSGPSSQVSQLTQQLLADPEVQSSVKDLMKDPEVLRILTSGNVLQDAMSMDPNKIQNNESIKKLMENQKIQEIMQKITPKLTGSNDLSPAAAPNP